MSRSCFTSPATPSNIGRGLFPAIRTGFIYVGRILLWVLVVLPTGLHTLRTLAVRRVVLAKLAIRKIALNLLVGLCDTVTTEFVDNANSTPVAHGE